MISIRNSNTHKKLLIDKDSNETDIELFNEVKEIFKDIKQKYPNHIVELISRKKAFRPKNKAKKGYIYCPYCRQDRIFQTKASTGNKHCPVCNISDRDYYVRQYNNLWHKK